MPKFEPTEDNEFLTKDTEKVIRRKKHHHDEFDRGHNKWNKRNKKTPQKT
jgi:hypothetical protein|tara:strand:- start:135 stop:284 length:150 start_codon:yes stop_codon:yes gene_type:complete